jgi:EAL domain-containing protein (putative c-di-GMP-specific phosphodiesterase class I)/ActR/RegA family two-component response regulator
MGARPGTWSDQASRRCPCSVLLSDDPYMTARALEKQIGPTPSSHRSADQAVPAPEGNQSVSPVVDAFVIDDEEGICRFVSLALANLGLTAASYHTAAHAVAALERGHPEIVFLDIALECSDAIDVLRMLGDKRYSGVVQLMSGSNTDLLDDVRRIGARHGLIMRAPLQKPFRMESVRQAISGAHFDGHPETTIALSPSIKLNLDELLAKEWLELWYQAKVDLRTGDLVGAEGLIRCRHPIHGVVGPDSYLPGASSASLAALTEYVVLAALRDWSDMAETGNHLRMAVNANLKSMTTLNLAALIRENRPRHEAWPGLILEVPEGDVVDDVALVHEIATQLRIYGISLAIDDFGEGYSSFARLRELPFCELKLDRGFVEGCADDTRNAGICRAIIELAHHFGVTAVAEGLEGIADTRAIRDMGCDIGQGYYFARPMPKSRFVSLLGERPVARRQWLA